MRMQGATDLEQRIVAVVERCERELPASELETTIVTTLGDAGRELQTLRGHWPKAEMPVDRPAATPVDRDPTAIKIHIDACIRALKDEDGRSKTRELALAVTKLQEATMWIDEHQRLS